VTEKNRAVRLTAEVPSSPHSPFAFFPQGEREGLVFFTTMRVTVLLLFALALLATASMAIEISADRAVRFGKSCMSLWVSA
jgi:hypothetical protein